MKEIQFIKSYYKPIQPSVKEGQKVIAYTEVSPSDELKSLVYCFWQLKTNTRLTTPFVYRVVSDGCVDIFFNHTQTTESFVMGFYRRYTEFSIGNEFDYIGIRFLPTAFTLLFGIDAKELSNQSQELKMVLPSLAQWLKSNLPPSLTFTAIVDRLNLKLINQLQQVKLTPDSRFFNALNLILERKGYLNVEIDLATGLSPRQLRRFFNYYLGTSAKAFCRVVRFQHILNAKPNRESLRENKLFFDVGFYDQAHFIKDFKNFYGVTPSEAFQ